MSTDLLTAARRYAEKGWPVFPCRPRGKEPLTPNGFANATTDEAQIVAWWTQWPDANIGFVPGRAGLICFDLDGPDGEAAAQRLGLCAEPTLSVTTGRGRHLYFKRPDFHVGNRPLAPHLDVRCDDGYTILPPSVHLTGAIYTRAGTVQDLKRLPPSLEVLRQGNGRPHAAAVLPERIPEGQRNETLTSIAGSMRRRNASEHAILAALREENTTRCEPPLNDDELAAIAHSVARYAPAPLLSGPIVSDAKPGSAPESLSPWGHAQSAPEFLATVEPDVAFLKPRLLVAGGLTFLFSPRGLGKTHIGHAIAVELAQEGLRVLLLDRDNPDREFHRRLQGWAAASAPTLKVMSRRHAPALTNTLAWACFPVTDYDVLILDSLDSFVEGVGEQDSSRVSRALATLLDIVRRPDGPAVLVPGNTVKTAAHSRGSGVVEDRADIVYEVRDATDLKPTGTKAWWEELPPAGVEAWAQRAARRKRRTVYRLALVPSKFRVGSEPDPFVLEVDLGVEPWTLRDVTSELDAAGDEALAVAARAEAAEREKASQALAEAIRDGAEPNRTTAVELLMEHGLTQKAAREVLDEGEGRFWRTETRTGLHGRAKVLVSAGATKDATRKGPPETPSAARANETPFSLPSDTKANEKCPEIAQSPQGVSEGSFPVAGPEEALKLALDTLDPTGWDAVNATGAALLERLRAERVQ
jgi:NAD(P)-dependent dehydrogenase (short-subunit alcohol dehydrogenase family)